VAGLNFIHRHKNLTHGDVKPDNLLISESRLKISDFGLAMAIRNTLSKLTGDVTRKGTSFFMAPEKYLPGRPGSMKPATDVWGFGCCIVNMVTGQFPFAPLEKEQDLKLALEQKTPLYRKEQARAGHPQKLLDLSDKCCHYDAAVRPEMHIVEEQLRRILASIQSDDGLSLPPMWLERGCSLHDPTWIMLECAAGSKDFELIKTRLDLEMGACVTLLKVEMNVNVDLFRRYHLERARALRENGNNINECFLWHATKKENDILEKGFDTNFCGLDFEYYGAGIYLAPDSTMSNVYAASAQPPHYPSDRSMLLCRVACGKMAERPPLQSSSEYQEFLKRPSLLQLSSEERKRQCQDMVRRLLRMPKNRTCPSGSHSQLGVDITHTRKSKTEVVVNGSFQAFPAYRISYRLSRALPDPRQGDSRTNLRTLDEYKASDFHKRAAEI